MLTNMPHVCHKALSLFHFPLKNRISARINIFCASSRYPSRYKFLLLQPKKYVVKRVFVRIDGNMFFQSNFVRVIVHRTPALHPTLLPNITLLLNRSLPLNPTLQTFCRPEINFSSRKSEHGQTN